MPVSKLTDRNEGCVYRAGAVLLLISFLIFSTAGFNEVLAAQAEPWKPSKPMKIILSGLGAYDLIARQLARVLPDYLGQRVTVQIVEGAQGFNAMDVLHGSNPDGHTISLLGVATYVGLTTKSLYSWNVRDIPVIMALDAPPYGIFGSPKSPFLSYQDIVKTKTPIRIALAGATFIVIPLIVDFDKKGIPYKFARFKGVEEAKLAVLAGNADLTSGALTGINTQQIKTGDITLLWIYSAKRVAEFPNVPTHFELGMPKEWSDYALTRLIQVPPSTPGHIQSALREVLIKAFKDKRTIEWSAKTDTPVDLLPEAEFKQRINFLIKAFKENQKIVEAYY
jgi:tripartite-type tricarboxylate transporter receptor subunit TctC